MASKICQHLGRAIRERREALGLSQEELAHGADVSRVYLGSLERGAQAASIEVIERIARALSVSVSELLDGSPAGEASVRPEDLLGRRIAAVAKGATPEQLDVFLRVAATYFAAVAGNPGSGKRRPSKGKG